jgi:hemoglobin
LAQATVLAGNAPHQLVMVPVEAPLRVADALVDEYFEVVADDIRVALAFADSDIPRLREKLIEQVCMLSGGPCEYTGDPMSVVHGGLNITEAQFNAGVEDLQEAMGRLNLSESAQNRLLVQLAPLRGDIIYR